MDFAAIIAVLSALSGMALGWLGRNRTIRQDVAQDASIDAVQRADVDYIKRGVDDIRLDQKAQGQQIVALGERVTRVEESYKSLHKRVDKIEE